MENIKEIRKEFCNKKGWNYLEFDEQLEAEEYALFLEDYIVNQEKMKWIDCKDRLPEIPSEKYLVIYDNMVKISLFRGDHNKFQEDIYSSENNVTHWLPLPTKPLMP